MGCICSSTSSLPSFDFPGNRFDHQESTLLYKRFYADARFTGQCLKRHKTVIETMMPSEEEQYAGSAGNEMTSSSKKGRIWRRNSFIRHFPFLQNHQGVFGKIFFQAFFGDGEYHQKINYRWYLRLMSVIARGSAEDKAHMTMRMIDINHDRMIERTELVQFVNMVKAVLDDNSACGESSSLDSEAIAARVFEPLAHLEDEVLNTCFDRVREHELDEDKTHSVDHLTEKNEFYGEDRKDQLLYHEFMDAAVHIKEFTSCFGLFPFIFKEYIEPVLHMTEKKGVLHGFLKTARWGSRYCVVANGFMVFYDKKDMETNQPTQMISLQEAKVYPHVQSKLGNEFVIRTPQFTRIFEAPDQDVSLQWIGTIWKNCGPDIPHRFNSFAPVRKGGSTFYADGKSYFHDLAMDLQKAKKQILVTGWCLSPNFYLTRTRTSPDQPLGLRFDELLKEAAERGVKVYVLIWQEVAKFSYLNSTRVSSHLNNLHENIFCMRDGGRLRDLKHLWTHHQKSVTIDQTVSYMGGFDVAFNRWDDMETYSVLDEDAIRFPGKHYVNPMARTPNHHVTDPLTPTAMKRDEWPRMPWHDLQVKVSGECALDAAKNFMQRWEISRAWVNNSHFVVPIIEAVHQETEPKCVDRKSLDSKRPVLDGKKGKIQSADAPETTSVTKKVYSPEDIRYTKHQDCNIQVLRSVGDWSFELEETESSMYNAQLHAILNAKYYVYIETQFFISAVRTDQVNPSNLLLKAIADRIGQAIEKKEPFKVIFLTPQHTCSDMNSLFTQILMYWQHSCMFRGKLSIFGHLKELYSHVDIRDYIHIGSLRNWGRFKSGEMVTEMVYVHSKGMIIDDKVAFVSSNNMNDRSMLGARDSELGAMIEDCEMIDSFMNGKPVKVARFAHEFRMKLWKHFLGLKDDELDKIRDPVAAFDLWKSTASSNSKVYKEVFQMLTNDVQNLNQLWYITNYDLKSKYYVPKKDEEEKRLKEGIKGFLVDYPESFLETSYRFPATVAGIDALYA